MARIADVGRLAGVTPSVVSRVLNRDDTLRVRDETRERVLAAARTLDYTPNHAARALRRSRVGTLGLAVHDISNPVYAPLIAGAQAAASAHEYVLLLADVAELARDSRIFGRVVGSGAIDGLLLLPAGIAADRMVEDAVDGRVPTVVINDRSRQSPSIGLADLDGAALATRHLLDLGHRDIAMLRLDGRGYRATQRTEGFRRAMRERGLEPGRTQMVNGGHTSEAGRAAMRTLLKSRSGSTAIVAASSLSAVGALSAAEEAGLHVPEELSVIGLHDLFFAEYLTPPLTVVRLPLRRLGEGAVELLVATIDSPTSGHRVIDDPPPELIVRGSTGLAATATGDERRRL